MEAKQTIYNGVCYRSRLEAKWAMMFDVVGIDFVYEYKQMLTIEGLYLPDFYMHDLRLWVEVKPSINTGPLPEEISKLKSVCDYHNEFGFIVCGFPSPKDNGVRVILFCPGMEPTRFYLHWDVVIDGTDFGLLMWSAASSVNSKIKDLNVKKIGESFFPFFMDIGMIDRYRHNKAMQERNMIERSDKKSFEAANKMLKPVRECIYLFMTELRARG